MKYRPRSGCDQLQKLDNFFILTHAYKSQSYRPRPQYLVIHLSHLSVVWAIDRGRHGYTLLEDNGLDCRVFLKRIFSGAIPARLRISIYV